MKNFRFRLQAVLEHRERRETLAKQTFAEAQASLSRAQILLAEMREVRQAILDELCRRRAGAFDAFETQMYQDYMQVITQSIADQEGFVRELICSCEAQKLHMIGTSQDRQALDSVRDRHKTAHSQLAQRIEQSAMDEIATTRFTYNQRTSGN